MTEDADEELPRLTQDVFLTDVENNGSLKQTDKADIR
jgi:hypothetical protein